MSISKVCQQYLFKIYLLEIHCNCIVKIIQLRIISSGKHRSKHLASNSIRFATKPLILVVLRYLITKRLIEMEF